jgi:hypothetical protein
MRIRHAAAAPGLIRSVACYLTIVACLPYLVLKALWLSGHSTGAADAAGAAELLDQRHIVGDVVTAGMELAAIALVLALTYPWGRRLPAAVVLAPIWVATGLLAPIALGLPLGLVVQAFAGGSAAPAGNGLQGWVYAAVYGGFIVQAVGVLAAFVGYARARWPEMFRMRTPQLGAVPRPRRRLAAVAATIAACYATILIVWSAAGARLGGPAGFDTVTQKTFLLATGLVVFVGVAGVLTLVWRWGSGRIVTPLTLAWIGTGVTLTSGPAHVALSAHGDVGLPLVSVSLTASLSALLLAYAAVQVLTRVGVRG